MSKYAEQLANNVSLSAPEAKMILEKVIEAEGVNIGRVMPALRLSLTGQSGGPDLMTILEILGPEESKKRIIEAIDVLKDKVKT